MEQAMHSALDTYRAPWSEYEQRQLHTVWLDMGDLGAREAETEYKVTKSGEGRPKSVEVTAVKVYDLGDLDVFEQLSSGALEFLSDELMDVEIAKWEGRK